MVRGTKTSAGFTASGTGGSSVTVVAGPGVSAASERTVAVYWATRLLTQARSTSRKSAAVHCGGSALFNVGVSSWLGGGGGGVGGLGVKNASTSAKHADGISVGHRQMGVTLTMIENLLESLVRDPGLLGMTDR